jgi:hypothetical protein
MLPCSIGGSVFIRFGSMVVANTATPVPEAVTEMRYFVTWADLSPGQEGYVKRTRPVAKCA